MAQQWILRKGSKESGFHYVAANGRKIRSKSDLERIDALRIPPAWREVHIAVSSRAPVQAWGFDARGRKQYRYHARAVQKGELAKHYRVRQLASDLPKLRRKLREDFGRGDFSKERVCAGIVLLISDAFFRVGSERYERENNTFGVTTLRKSHVNVDGETVEFDYRGKRSIRQWRPYHQPSIAAFIESLLSTPGPRLFRYEREGSWSDVTARDVNEYIRNLADFPYTAKDFRTWGGTLRMAIVLAELGTARNENARKKTVAQAVRFVASELQNTPAIARKSYVHPVLISRYVQNGATIVVRHPPRSLIRRDKRSRHTAEEKALIAFLAKHFPERRKERRIE